MEQRQRIALVFGVAFPILALITILGGSIIISMTQDTSSYDFVYMAKSGSSTNLGIADEPLTINEALKHSSNDTVGYYIHDPESNTSKQLSEEELMQLEVIGDFESGDGYTFEKYYYSSSLFNDLFGSGSQGPGLLKNDTFIAQNMVELDSDNNSPRTIYYFIGWVE